MSFHIITVLAVNTNVICSDCDKIVTLLKQSGVHVDTVANKLHLPKDVVEAAWDVFQATGKCSG